MKRICLVLLSILAVLIVSAPAAHADAGITLSRSPAPPSAVLNNGTTQQRTVSYSGTLTYDTAPSQYVVEVEDPNGAVVDTQTFSISSGTPGAGSPRTFGPSSYVVPNGATAGRWIIRVTYVSQTGPPFAAGGDAQAEVVFYVANAVGTVNVTKYEDLNGNGSRDPGEPGVNNWGFQVTSPQPGGGTTTTTVHTAADGTTSINNAPVGDYTIAEIGQAGWQATTPTQSTFTLNALEDHTFAVGNAHLAQLCGTVFIDPNENGTLNNGETGVSGVTLTLGGTTGSGGGVNAATAVSNNSGAYCFTNLLPGTYHVRETVPSGYRATGDKDGPNNGKDFIDTIVVVSGQSNNGNDFGLVQDATPQPTSICGTVFQDPNTNGQLDPKEIGVTGVTLTLNGTPTGQTAITPVTAQSNSTGRYCFTNVTPGSYSVKETVPSGYIATGDKDGPGNGKDFIQPIVAVSGQPNEGNDFGLFQFTSLRLTKTANHKTVRQGSTVKYKMTVCNRGSTTAKNVVLSDPLPSGTSISRQGGAVFSKGQLVWRLGNINVKKCVTKYTTLRFDADASIGKHPNKANADADNAKIVYDTYTVKVVKKPRPPRRIVVTG